MDQLSNEYTKPPPIEEVKCNKAKSVFKMVPNEIAKLAGIEKEQKEQEQKEKNNIVKQETNQIIGILPTDIAQNRRQVNSKPWITIHGCNYVDYFPDIVKNLNEAGFESRIKIDGNIEIRDPDIPDVPDNKCYIL